MSQTAASVVGAPRAEAQLDLLSRAAAIAGLAGIALVHLLDLPSKFEETPYQAVLFAGLIVTSLAIAEWLLRGGATLAWASGAAVCVLTLAGFVVSRTIGLPGAPEDDLGNWTEGLGLASVLIEVLVLWVCVGALVRSRRGAGFR